MAKLTKSKAKEILHDGTAHKHPLTDKQRRFFAAKAFADIGVSLPNYNDSHASLPSGFVGMGNSTKGFNYNGGWGGTMQMGGNLQGVMGNMYARIGAPSNGKYAKKTKASAKNGKMMPDGGMLATNLLKTKTGAIATNQYNSNGLQGWKVPVDQAKSLYNQLPTNPDDHYVHIWSHESPDMTLDRKLHPGIPVNTYNITGNTANTTNPQGSNVQLTYGGEVSPYYINGNDFKTKGMQNGGDINDAEFWRSKANEVKQRNAKRDSVRDVLYNKYPHDYNKVNNEMLKYFEQEKPINTDMGQWKHPGKITKIGSNKITMQGVPYPVLGVSDRGHAQLMHPGGEYQYQGNSVTEYPIMAEGGQLKHLNQLINFTNNNHMEQAKSGIHIKPSHKGLLHKHLGIPEGKKIPASKLAIKKGDSAKTIKQKTFAKNAKTWSHENGGLISYAQDGYQGPNLSQYSTPAPNFGNPNPPQGMAYQPLNLGAKSPRTGYGNYQAPQLGSIGDVTKSGGTDFMGKIDGALGSVGGLQGGLNIASGLTTGVKMLNQENKQAKQAEQFADLSGVVAKAAQTRPEKVKRKYVRPEDIAIQPEQMFPTYGTGTNYLAKNGAEIQNTYAPNTLYNDLGYEPLDDSNQMKQFQWGGFLNDNSLSGLGGAIGGSLGGGNLQGAGNAGSQIGGTLGKTLGNLAFPGVGGIVGDFAGKIIGGALDRNGRKINHYTNEGNKNMNIAATQGAIQNAQTQNVSFMEDGGMMSHDWQPQVITKFGEYSMKDLLKPDPMMNTLRSGGHLKDEFYTPVPERGLQTYALGGELKTHWGGKAETMSNNPYLPGGGETVMFKGQSHDESDGYGNSGIGVTFGNSPVEVERGEPAVKLQDGGSGQNNLVVFGNMTIPSYGAAELGDKDAKNRKFKNYISDLSKLEAKQNKTVDKGSKLVTDTDDNDTFDLLKMNSGKALMEGGNMKLKDIAKKKETAAMIQNAILESAQEHGIDSEALSRGKIKKAKNGAKMGYAQNSIQIPENTSPAANMFSNFFGKKVSKIVPFDSAANYPDYSRIPDKPLLEKKGISESKTVKEAVKGKLAPDNEKYFNKVIVPMVKSGVSPDELFKKKYISKDYAQKAKQYYNPGTESDYIGLQNDKYFDIGLPKIDVPQIKGGPNMSPITTDKGGATEDNFIPSKGIRPNAFGQLWPYFRPTNQIGLDPNQLAGEMYALSNDQLDPVQAQLYHPQLDQPYDISFQDQLNANQADFNAIQRQTGYNPAAQAVLAGQKYAANSGVLGAQFRANQAEKAQVYSKNRDLLNDAQLKNLGILDQQYVRQAQAKTNTKAIAQSALSSIADKITQNKLENRTLGVYENLYGYRFDNQGRAYNLNAPVDFQQTIDNSTGQPSQGNSNAYSFYPGYEGNYDAQGRLTGTRRINKDKTTSLAKQIKTGILGNR